MHILLIIVIIILVLWFLDRILRVRVPSSIFVVLILIALALITLHFLVKIGLTSSHSHHLPSSRNWF